jgi:acetoacetate decarboxylase
VSHPPIYRMPVGFGPALGPRNGPNGRSFNGEWSRCTTVGVSYRTDREALARVLPDRFVPADDPIVRVQCHFNTDFAWLAGRGYNFAEVLFAAIYEGEEETLAGDFVAVMWESKADPMIPGREEIGLPKMFADIPDLETDGACTRMSADWEGFRFLELELDGLTLGPWPSGKEATTEPVKLGIGGSSGRHRMYYKYIPRTGEWDKADAAYATASPPGNYDMKVLENWKGSGSVVFHEARWEDLPTLAHIVNGLAALPVIEITDASMGRVMVAFNDLRDQRILR